MLSENESVEFDRVNMILADALFFGMRNNVILFKDLGKKQVHYSVFYYGSTIDLHQTLEGHTKKHFQLAKIEFDWRYFWDRMRSWMAANWTSIFKIGKCQDPRWKDLEIEFLPAEAVVKLLSQTIKKGSKWNLNEESLRKLENLISKSRLGDLPDRAIVVGIGAGYLIFSNGTDCMLFDFDKLNAIIEKNAALSVRKISFGYFTIGAILWCFKIRLLHIQVDILGSKIPFHLRESLFLHDLLSLFVRK